MVYIIAFIIIVWIPKSLKQVLRDEVKQFVKQRLRYVETYSPEVEIEKYRMQVDHVHLIIVIPPKFAASAEVGKTNANTRRAIRKHFE